MDIITKTKKIIQDILTEYKASVFEISAKKTKVAKMVTDRIDKDKIEDLRKALNSK